MGERFSRSPTGRWGSGHLAGWARSESVAMVGASVDGDPWGGEAFWPVSLGADADSSSFAGQLGLLVVRDHPITTADFDGVWPGGAPVYFTPASTEDGGFTGSEGVRWMIGYGTITRPNVLVNPDATGAEIGSTVTRDNLLVLNRADDGDYYSAARLESVAEQWTNNDCDDSIYDAWCDEFDANGDARVDGVELAWLGRSFGLCSVDPSQEWWYLVDYTMDGCVGGDDLAVLGGAWRCADSNLVCE